MLNRSLPARAGCYQDPVLNQWVGEIEARRDNDLPRRRLGKIDASELQPAKAASACGLFFIQFGALPLDAVVVLKKSLCLRQSRASRPV